MRLTALVIGMSVALPGVVKADSSCEDTSRRSGFELGFEALVLEDAATAYGVGLELAPLVATVFAAGDSVACLRCTTVSLGLGGRLTWFPDVSFLNVHGSFELALRLGRSRWQLSLQLQAGLFAARSTHGLDASTDGRFTWGPQGGGGIELRRFVLNGHMYVGLRAALRAGIEWLRPLEGTPLTFVATVVGLGLGGTW